MVSENRKQVAPEESESSKANYSRRKFVQTAGALGVTTSLAGCGGGDDDEGTDGTDDGGTDGTDDGGTDGTSEQDFVWWTLGGTPSENEVIENIANEFEDAADQNVNVSTRVVSWGDAFQEWPTAIEGRNTPNVTETAGEFAADFANRGALDPLTELFNQYDDWYDTAAASGVWNDEVWSIPWFLETRITTHNMDILNEAGHDTPPETWEEMIRVGQDVEEETDANGVSIPGARSSGTGQIQYSFVTQSGGEYYGFEDDQWSVEADNNISLFAHLWAASLEESWDVTPDGWAGHDMVNVQELYFEERSGTMMMTTGHILEMIDDESELLESTEITKTPAGPMGTHDAYQGGSNLASFSDEISQYEAGDLSQSFINHMIDPDNMEELMTEVVTNYLPVREAGEQAQPFSDNPTDVPDEWLDTIIDQASSAGVRPAVTNTGQVAPFTGALEVSTAGYSTALSAILGVEGESGDPKEALMQLGDQMRDEVNNVVDYQISRDEPPSLDDLPAELEPWVTGDNNTPQIWNPYE